MQNKNPKIIKNAARALFVFYVLAMLFILVIPNNYRGHNVIVGGLTLEQWSSFVANGFNLIPFRGIAEQIGSILTGNDVLRNTVYLFGNILGFVPLGFFLPILFEKQRKFGSFIATSTLAIMCIEILQLVTMRGLFDIDDIILNVLGACLGFWLLQKLVKRIIDLIHAS